MCSNRLPNLIIAGVNKSGSTSLFAYLSKHAEIETSLVKETTYFLPLRYGEELSDIQAYLSCFPNDPRRTAYRMEATPGYFYGAARVARAIDQTLPGVRIVVMLREPVSRLVSFFQFQKSMLNLDQNMSLTGYLDICREMSPDDLLERENNPYFGLEGGFYDKYLPDWLEVFGDRLKIVFFDQLKTEPARLVAELCNWLDLSAADCLDYVGGAENRTVAYKNPFLHRLALTFNRSSERFLRRHPKVKDGLRQIYQAFNTQDASLEMTAELEEELDGLYADANRNTGKILISAGYAGLPHWLMTPLSGSKL